MRLCLWLPNDQVCLFLADSLLFKCEKIPEKPTPLFNLEYKHLEHSTAAHIVGAALHFI